MLPKCHRMDLRQHENVLRVTLLVFNITFGMLSISLIALGAAYTNELWWPRNYVGLDFLELPTVLMLLGSISLMLSVAGCVCAKSHNRRFLLAFALLLMVVLSLELTISVICFINYNAAERGGNRTHRKLHYQEQGRVMTFNEPSLTKVEQHYKCCVNVSDDCPNYVMRNGTPFVQDCSKVIDKEIQRKAMFLGFFTLGISILQAIQIAFAYLLQYSLKGLENL